MEQYMEYTIKATVRFSGTYQQRWTNKLVSFSENGYTTFSTIAISREEAADVLLYMIDEMCVKMTQRGEFHFSFSDDFHGDDIYVRIPRLYTVHGSIAELSISTDDPRKWPIQKVIEKCSVEQAVSIFGDRIGLLLGLIKTDGDEV